MVEQIEIEGRDPPGEVMLSPCLVWPGCAGEVLFTRRSSIRWIREAKEQQAKSAIQKEVQPTLAKPGVKDFRAPTVNGSDPLFGEVRKV